MSGQVDIVAVTYRDRLARFDPEHLFDKHDVRVEVVLGDGLEDRQELVENLLEVVSSFAGKLYGTGEAQEELIDGLQEATGGSRRVGYVARTAAIRSEPFVPTPLPQSFYVFMIERGDLYLLPQGFPGPVGKVEVLRRND
ncbi:MAG: hypothetical protein RXQ79_07750 [Acidilobus sp.]